MAQQPLTYNSFENICQKWVSILKARESGIQMSYPIGGAHLRIRQFLNDNNLQKKLFNSEIPNLLFIDCNEIENISFESLAKHILEELKINKISLDDYLKKEKEKIGVFITGLDHSLKNKNIDILKHLGALIQKHPNFSVILFTEINITDSELYILFTSKSVFLQNIIYQPLYTYEDSLQFFSYLEEKWKCKFAKGKVEKLSSEIGGHFLLLKEAARILKTNPDMSVDEILSTPTLLDKTLAIFNLLSKKDQQIIINIMLGRQTDVSEYLKQTKLVVDNQHGLNYWKYIKDKILLSSNAILSFSNSLEIYLTPQERDAFEVLQDNKNIVSREMLAKAIWQNEWEDKYSDWAIDQMIHQIREKLLKSKAPYKIMTKKGEGFVLIPS